MSKKTIEFDEICKSCKGTGLYIGMAERNGAAVVCHVCKGTGWHHFKYEYEEFKERKPPVDVKRVYQVNPGICIGENGKDIFLKDFGGISLEDWQKGKTFGKGTENRKHTCPTWWYQLADYKKKPYWEECVWGVSFSACKCFSQKHKCWERFDSIPR